MYTTIKLATNILEYVPTKTPIINALIIGVLVGTYSSIFVASLIVVYMQPKS